MIVNNFPSSRSIDSPDSVFAYSGEYEFHYDGTGNWECKFLTSGNLTVSKKTSVDIFLVGGGGSGGTGYSYEASVGYGYYYGGGGGGGGECITQSSVQMERQNTYVLTIGAGGNNSDGGATSVVCGATTYSARGGKKGANGTYNVVRASGGQGGNPGGQGGSCVINFGTEQDIYSAFTGRGGGGTETGFWNTTTRAFGSENGDLYAGGGGGGNPAQNVPEQSSNGLGGAGGGGAYDQAGVSHTGGGGGGNSALNSSNLLGGSGGSGIIIIRNHRS